MMYIYIYIYIYIYKYLLKSQIFLFFSEALPMCNQITNENTDKIQITQQHYKSKLKNTYRIKEIIVKGEIQQCHFKRRSSEE